MTKVVLGTTIPYADQLHSVFYIELESLLSWAARTRPGGIPVKIGDTKRSYHVQLKAYENWKTTGRNLNGHVVPSIAHPDHSKHCMGKAADLEAKPEDLRLLGEEWERRGNRWGGRWSHAEPWHFEI